MEERFKLRGATLGGMIIYVQEEAYGYRYSKYAARYRKMWPYGTENGEALAEWKNVATIKLVKNPNYQKGIKRKSTSSSDTQAIIHSVKGSKSSGEALYVTLPSVARMRAAGYGKRASAFTHSEHIAASALMLGYKKVKLEKEQEEEKEKKEEKVKEKEQEEEKETSTLPSDAYDLITENGKYLIKWIYTERSPCPAALYDHPCKDFLERLSQTQYNLHKLPIEVYYSVPYEHQEDFSLKAKANITVEGMTHYPLSTNQEMKTRREEDLKQDVALGCLIIKAIGVGQEDINLSEQEMEKILESADQSALDETKNKIEANILAVKAHLADQLKADIIVGGLLGRTIETVEDVKEYNEDFYNQFHKPGLMQLDSYNAQLSDLDVKRQEDIEMQERLISGKSSEKVIREYEEKFKNLIYQLFENYPSLGQEMNEFYGMVQRCQDNLSKLNNKICVLRKQLLTKDSSLIMDDEREDYFDRELKEISEAIEAFRIKQVQKAHENEDQIKRHNEGVIPKVASAGKKPTLSNNTNTLYHTKRAKIIPGNFQFENDTYDVITRIGFLIIKGNDPDKLARLKEVLEANGSRDGLQCNKIVQSNDKWAMAIALGKSDEASVFEKIQNLVKLQNEHAFK